MKCEFVVGQKVVCVEEFGAQSLCNARKYGVSLPSCGSVYTVREFDDEGYILCIRLNEIVNGPDPVDGEEPSFDARMFRPVATRKTDISCFTAMLNTFKEKVPL